MRLNSDFKIFRVGCFITIFISIVIILTYIHCKKVRNKLEYVLDNFCDFDVICFTETHLDTTILNENLFLGNQYDPPYRKDRTSHGGGIIVYPSVGLIHKRRLDFEIFWDECIWLEIRMNNQNYLIGVFYSPKPCDVQFFDSFNFNVEKAMESSKNFITVGDLNEDLLNPNYHKLRNVLIETYRTLGDSQVTEVCSSAYMGL